MTSQAVARRVLQGATLLLAIAIILAVIAPTGPDGYVTGAVGRTANVLGFVSIFGAWITAIWHAAGMRPWRLAPPRWLVIILLVFGSGIAGILYYILVAHWDRQAPEPARAPPV